MSFDQRAEKGAKEHCNSHSSMSKKGLFEALKGDRDRNNSHSEGPRIAWVRSLKWVPGTVVTHILQSQGHS